MSTIKSRPERQQTFRRQPRRTARFALRAVIAWAIAAVAQVSGQLQARSAAGANPSDRERGDVPGWVMITLMSAVLVAALLAIAAPALENLFNSAIDQVSQR